MDKYLNDTEKEDFLKYLKENKLADNKILASIFYCSETTISTRLTRFPRKQKSKESKVHRTWKDLIELRIENAELKDKLAKIKLSVGQ